MTYWALGLDPSLTHTALVLGNIDVLIPKKLQPTKSFAIKVDLKHYPHEVARLGDLVPRLLSVFEVCEELIPSSSRRVLAIEGYSFGSPGRVAQLGEWGGQIRLTAWERGWTTIAVPPSTLKKFATGKGNAEKDTIMMEILSRWGYKATDNNNADAYALMRVGVLFAAHLDGKAVSQEAQDLFKKCSVYTPVGQESA